ncbi:murein L,D-transpeptidase catalytic domain family protein [Mangrovibacterium lignilyticum]|uniref:murein L,D-transpeptidase catalytic domain family protein n=1 Tax=Mangrovibacterium lignilyticum TaxID=2668052 RepID=UPI0013D808B8|nr:murein L,D-transpeptidase catalytic domain family protein [Mangrovibacterium lignilyticum]
MPTNSVDTLYTRYNSLNLSGKLPYPIFARAMGGFHAFHFKNNQILTIIDFTKVSTERRCYVIDLKANKLLFESLVAHGKNSGVDYAQTFSNKEHSLMSSPGFYSTAETYLGKHGYSLRLDGLEKGINDHARTRAIVIHGADYVSEKFIRKIGRLGRSWGCPALPSNLNKEIIDYIKNGTCLYIHTNNQSYLAQSPI